jgi:serine/threonine protein kinase
MQATNAQLSSDTVVQDRYRIVRLIGRGGMGAVYEAVDQRLKNTVALKQMLVEDEELRAAFEHEAQLLAVLRHPALPKVIDHFTDGDRQFLVMEFIPGIDLATLQQQRGTPFAVDDVLQWADKLLDALQYLHAQTPPIIHRDIKPQNLKLTPGGEIVLLDFGLSKGQANTYAAGASGQSVFGFTLHYAPLEQIQGAGTEPRSDLYAFAATLYTLFTGLAPAHAPIRAASKNADPLRPVHEINPQVPEVVGMALAQALELDVDARPESAAALRAMLRGVRHEQPSYTTIVGKQVFISYKRGAEPDEPLAKRVYAALGQAGHRLFIDQNMKIGVEWAREIERQIEASDFLMVFLSEASMNSEMVAKEVEHAHRHYQRTGRARLLPVRVHYSGALPYSLSPYLDQIQQAVWQNDADTEPLIAQLLDAVNHFAPLPAPAPQPAIPASDLARPVSPKPAADLRFIESLREPSGAARLRSPFYIEREGDERLQRQLSKPYGTTTTIRAPRQTGKSSLLIRSIAQAQAQGSKAVSIDLQPVEEHYLESMDSFLRYFTTLLVTKLRLDVRQVDKAWESPLGAPDKTTYLMEEYILPQFDTKMILAIDEADRLLRTSFHDSFFGLLRFWHNNRAMNELWDKLDIVMVISTEPHLLIKDVSQSPFNVGSKIVLEDFDFLQVRELNQRYRSPLDEPELQLLMDFLNGHPYLTRKALYTIITEQITWEHLTAIATTQHSPFGDHLHRYLWLLRDQPQLRDALKQIIARGRCSDEVLFYRLSQAGLVKGSDSSHCMCRCRLYTEYLRDKL